MATNYGKILRKIRIDADELLKDMAENVGVSPAFLSAVENGNKSPSEKVTEAIIVKYSLNQQLAAELRLASKDDVYSTVVQLDLRGKEAANKNLALSFARQFDSLSDNDVDEIKKILIKGNQRYGL